MEEDILLVPYQDLSQWPNDLHLQFSQTQDEQMDAEFDADHPAPDKLATAISGHKAAVGAENAAYIIARGSELTEQIAAQDAIRDAKLDEVNTLTTAMLRMASLPQMQQAAQVFRRGWDVYSPNAKAAYEAETSDLQQWHEDYLASAEQQQAARTLGIEQIIADMMAANQEVHRLIVLCENTQGQQRSAMSLKDARAATDRAYKWMVLVLNSYHVIDANPARYDELTQNLISQQEYYLNLVKERQRNNRRVFVGSELVGNHYYAVSTGWTWLTLAQRNAKALSPDPAPSAPGVEPVVVPRRIVSADKKALAAGGLCVALDGVPVKPSDAVYCGRKYELVAVAEE